jgi:hypothetical protein
MNAIRTLAALILLGAASASAQTAGADSAATPAAIDPASVEVSEARPIELIQRPEANARRAARDVDARHCLELGANAKVHGCAEKYRTRTLRARAPQPAPGAS